MRMRFSVGVTAAAILVGSTLSAAADIYNGPGFSGSLWVAEGGGQVQEMGTVHAGDAGFLLNMEIQGQSVSTLMKWDSDIVWSVIHGQRMYMEIPSETSGWEPYEARACSGYAEGEKLGDESLNGRATERWRCTGQTAVPQGEEPVDAVVWYDPELEMGIRSVEDNGNIFEVRDIAVGPQDAALFELPAGYQKLDMNALMMQMQQQQ
jgi:hypothetical protein